MALLSKADITAALQRLGELALQNGYAIELLVVGGTVMVLRYEARLATHDIDAVILAPEAAHLVRTLAADIAKEFGWPDDWLNDGAKGFVVGISEGPSILTAPGITVKQPTVAQLLAMKLSAWRDDVDIRDAEYLLRVFLEERSSAVNQEQVWRMLEAYLTPGDELKASYAFLDLWESYHGEN